MFFSIVVPVRNERAHLEACLEALLSQDYEGELEIIVVDGHSTDGTLDLLARLPVRVLLDGGVSVGEARNRGIQAAEGEVVAFLDGDCIADRGWVSALARRFRADPGLAGIGGALRVGPTAWPIARYEDWNAKAFYRGFITSNVAYRRDVLLQVGGFDERLRCAEDWDLLWRVLDARGRVAFEPSAVVTHQPVENGGLGVYLRKQWWYARSDAACHLRFVRRRRAALLQGHGAARSFRSVVRPAWTEAGLLAGAISGTVLRSPLVAGASAVGLGLWAARRVRRVLAQGVPPSAIPQVAVLSVLKAVVRGAGTLYGITSHLLAPEGALAPRPPQVGAPLGVGPRPPRLPLVRARPESRGQ